MNTSQSEPRSFVIETRFVWGKSITDAMELAMSMEKYGWKIQGNPAPMSFNGNHGTGVSISRHSYD